VLRAPDVPSVLIELGYLSNRAEERRLTNVAYRRDLARGVVRAIDHYFGEGRGAR
jgi:N-acetylmuramoyl-L-alanine amidase